MILDLENIEDIKKHITGARDIWKYSDPENPAHYILVQETNGGRYDCYFVTRNSVNETLYYIEEYPSITFPRRPTREEVEAEIYETFII
jgi:hypothetical protein